MTSDILQHQQATALPFLSQPEALPGPLPLIKPAQPQLSGTGLKLSLQAAINVLTRAHMMIERAEQTINAQADRIEQLEKLVTIDEVTGLLNRRGFFQAFVREVGRVNRDLDEGGILVMIDVDNFNTINRIYGPDAGDMCLRVVRHALISDIRKMDIAARLGADEFVLLMAGTDKERAAGRIQKLAMNLNNLSFIWHGAEICLSASIGMKSYGRGDQAETIFKAAGQDLSRSKEQRKRYATL